MCIRDSRYYDDGAKGILGYTEGQLDQYTGLATERGLSWAKA